MLLLIILIEVEIILFLLSMFIIFLSLFVRINFFIICINIEENIIVVVFNIFMGFVCACFMGVCVSVSL